MGYKGKFKAGDILACASEVHAVCNLCAVSACLGHLAHVAWAGVHAHTILCCC